MSFAFLPGFGSTALVLFLGVSHAVAKPAVLHEKMSAPKGEAERTARRLQDGSPIVGPTPSAEQNPTAIASQDKVLPEPSADLGGSNTEPILGTRAFGADRQTEAELDYATSNEDTLRYIEVFNPSVVPFKRMSALDSVRSDYTLYTPTGVLSKVRIGGDPTLGHDLFWGSVLVQLRPGQPVAIPSVSPSMRILSYEATPSVPMNFVKDAADNFYVQSDAKQTRDVVRLTFLVEADPQYFAPKIPTRLRIRSIPKALLQPLPKEVVRDTRFVLNDLRLHKNMFVEDALPILVAYFRNFDAKAPPPNTGNIYRDLVQHQAGVCRHRSFAFMITANALGIPTRYVANEAHAWVEIWLPGTDWMRIDLGGAANTLAVENAEDKAVYRPRGGDPFPQPSNYSDNYSTLEGPVTGLREEQIADRQRPYEEETEIGPGEQFGLGEDAADNGQLADTENESDVVGPGTTESFDLSEHQDKTPTRIEVSSVTPQGYRGETIYVTGRVSASAGGELAGLRIDIFLAPNGKDGNDSVLVGRSVANAGGDFQATVELPATLTEAAYQVYASTPGSATLQPAVSE